MINFDGLKDSTPLIKFKNFYKKAIKANQAYIEAASISTINSIDGFPDSRLVNIKYVRNNNFIFFSNYDSVKGKDISNNNKSSCVFFWDSINVQIRIKGKIKKCTSKFSDKHFSLRTYEKNVLASSSSQSKIIENYDLVKQKYQNFYDKHNGKILSRPKFWGGYEFQPEYYEFWEGNKNRINKREAYIYKNASWSSFFLEP